MEVLLIRPERADIGEASVGLQCTQALVQVEASYVERQLGTQYLEEAGDMVGRLGEGVRDFVRTPVFQR
ncbi:hypothetical protein D3C72_2446240 [compost metagenome]